MRRSLYLAAVALVAALGVLGYTLLYAGAESNQAGDNDCAAACEKAHHGAALSGKECPYAAKKAADGTECSAKAHAGCEKEMKACDGKMKENCTAEMRANCTAEMKENCRQACTKKSESEGAAEAESEKSISIE